MIVALLLASFFLCVLIGVPIAFAMGIWGAVWIVFFVGLAPTVLARIAYNALDSFPLVSIPLFHHDRPSGRSLRHAAQSRALAATCVRLA